MTFAGCDMKTAIALLCAAAVALALAACNTLGGDGKDIKKVGEDIEKAAERHK